MTIGAALGQGLQVTVVGLCIVFGVLIILMLVLMAFKAIFYKEPKKAAEALPNAESIALPAAHEPQPEPKDDSELIAVLTAAIAASLNTSTYNLNIKSYRRIGNASPAWNKAGLDDVINSRF